jgi:hypothetical protein
LTAASPKARIGVVLPYLAFAVVAIGMINFLWFMSETLPLNLIPSDGQVSAGHYFLWSKTNGGYVEVSRSFWEWSRFHERSLFATWPLVMLAIGYLVFAYLASDVRGSISPALVPARVRQVRGSGPLKASTRGAGLIGRAWFSRPLLRTWVYPGGIVVKPPFMAERAILAAEISAVTPKGGLSAQSVPDRQPVFGFGVSEVPSTYQPRGQFVQVEHAGVGMASPLVLVGSGNWDIAQAMSRVAEEAHAHSVPNLPASTGEGNVPSNVEPNAAAHISSVHGPNHGHLPAPIELGLTILGIIIGIALLWFGFTWAIPQTGLFGVAWTVVVILILAANMRRSWRRRRE